MKQIIYIHWWVVFPDNETFCKVLEKREYEPFEEKKRRIDWLVTETKGTHEIMKPTMPNKYNALYKAWKIRFEKTFAYMNNEELIVIGHSLGWMFLLKYLWENTFPKAIKQLHLISSCIDDKNIIDDEIYLWDFTFDLTIIPKVQDIAEKIFIYHSTDDVMVPYNHAERLHTYLPKATLMTFTDRWHLRQPEFPELLQNLLK